LPFEGWLGPPRAPREVWASPIAWLTLGANHRPTSTAQAGLWGREAAAMGSGCADTPLSRCVVLLPKCMRDRSLRPGFCKPILTRCFAAGFFAGCSRYKAGCPARFAPIQRVFPLVVQSLVQGVTHVVPSTVMVRPGGVLVMVCETTNFTLSNTPVANAP
jgi:hypothetical protein